MKLQLTLNINLPFHRHYFWEKILEQLESLPNEAKQEDFFLKYLTILITWNQFYCIEQVFQR